MLDTGILGNRWRSRQLDEASIIARASGEGPRGLFGGAAHTVDHGSSWLGFDR